MGGRFEMWAVLPQATRIDTAGRRNRGRCLRGSRRSGSMVDKRPRPSGSVVPTACPPPLADPTDDHIC
jgi:hypothetical protein